MKTGVSSPASLLLVPWTIRSTLFSVPVCRSRSSAQCSPWPGSFSPRTPPVVGLCRVVYLCSFASSILLPRPTSHSLTCRDYGLWPSSTGPIADGNRSRLGYPGFRAKSLHACSGALTPRVRCAPRDIAAHQCCLPHCCTRSAHGLVISELISHACMPPVNASPLALRRADA